MSICKPPKTKRTQELYPRSAQALESPRSNNSREDESYMEIQPRRSKKEILINANSLEEGSRPSKGASWFLMYHVVFWQKEKLASTNSPHLQAQEYTVSFLCAKSTWLHSDTMEGKEQREMCQV